jgi:hypothetical protein
MSATVGTNDRPALPETGGETGTGPPDRPELVSVGRRNGWRPALLAVTALAIVLTAAVWKPWEGRRPATAIAPGSVPTDSRGGLLPATTSGPDATDGFTTGPAETFATFSGLNLELMGSSDPHAAWGVAVAYMSRTQIDDATAGGSSTVTPVVSWELIDPGGGLGPTLDHPGTVSVAIAATWPSGTRPLAVRASFTPYNAGIATGPEPRPAAGTEVGLGEPLSSLLGTAASPGPGPTSGSFFLPPVKVVPGDPASWVGHGWAAGDYVLTVELQGGARMDLPFAIRGPVAP